MCTAEIPRRKQSFPATVLWFIQHFLIVIILASPLYVAADQSADQAEKLQQLRDRIGAIKRELHTMRSHKDTLQLALEKTEIEIGQVAAGIAQLAKQSAAVRNQVRKLGQERNSARTRLVTMRASLERELQVAYLSGRQQRVKLLLSQKNPATIGRLLVYHGYFSRARTRLIQDIRESLAAVARLDVQLVEQQAGIGKLLEEQQEKTSQLHQEQAHRREILARVRNDLQSRSAELSTLQQDEKQLHKLVLSLQQLMSDIPPDSSHFMPLSRLKGKLDWPVAGRITLKYGAPHAAGKLRSRGVRISTRVGTDISAVATGRVAFSDWLRGFGLLLIIDHGEGYMTLYGQNRSLYKDVGEWVERGEVIAAAGSSGGHFDAGLYLELRKDGRPVNPGKWFRGKPAALAGR